MAGAKDSYNRSCYCVTCQRKYLDRYSHAKKYPSHVISRQVEAKNVESDTLSSDDSTDEISQAAQTQAGEEAKKVSGADFASQPIFVATAGVGLGWITAKVFGPEQALQKEEAYGIAAGVLRLLGRHFLSKFEMKELTEANNDVNDFLLISRAISHYIGRLWKSSEQEQPQAQQQPRPQPQPAPPPEQPAPEPRPAAAARQNGRHAPTQEEEAAFIQQQWAFAALNMPYLGSEAA